MAKSILYSILFCLVALSIPSNSNGQCDYYSVKFSNATNKEIHLAVHYIPLDKQITSESFESKAWYTIQPGESRLIFHTRCFTFYWYADTPYDRNGNRDEWRGDYKFYVDGKYFRFIKSDCRDYNARLEGKACVIVQSMSN